MASSLFITISILTQNLPALYSYYMDIEVLGLLFTWNKKRLNGKLVQEPLRRFHFVEWLFEGLSLLA